LAARRQRLESIAREAQPNGVEALNGTTFHPCTDIGMSPCPRSESGPSHSHKEQKPPRRIKSIQDGLANSRDAPAIGQAFSRPSARSMSTDVSMATKVGSCPAMVWRHGGDGSPMYVKASGNPMRVHPWTRMQRMSLRAIRATEVHRLTSPYRPHMTGSCIRGVMNGQTPAATCRMAKPISVLLMHW
jgi:hypothetical protein